VFYHIELLDDDGSYADFLNYIYASISFYVIEKLLRLLKVLYLNGFYHHDNNRRGLFLSSGKVALLSPTKDVLTIDVQLRGHGLTRWLEEAGHCGSSVQLWIPRLQPLSSHPFTVANISKDSEGRVQLLLLVKVHAGVTQKLMKRIQQGGGRCELSMAVEGFYGQHKQVSGT
jgi:predicted ferric reductase